MTVEQKSYNDAENSSLSLRLYIQSIHMFDLTTCFVNNNFKIIFICHKLERVSNLKTKQNKTETAKIDLENF